KKHIRTLTLRVSSWHEVRLPNEFAKRIAKMPGPFRVSIEKYPVGDPIGSISVEAIDSRSAREIRKIYYDSTIPETERKALISARRGQGKFRASLIRKWRRCAVTGLANRKLLRASHIKPWADSTNSERLDPLNGLLLSPNLDCAFDCGLISFDRHGAIVLSRLLSPKDLQLLGISSGMRLRGGRASEAFMAFHRRRVFKK